MNRAEIKRFRHELGTILPIAINLAVENATRKKEEGQNA